MRSYNIRKRNNLILGALAIVLITMAGGYAIFSSNLNITGTSNISNNWDIRISKVAGTLGGHAAHATDNNENEINPECDSTTSTPKSCGEGLSVTFSDLFYYEGDSSTYNITLKNSGSLDASLTQNVEPVVTTNSDKIHVELTGFKTKGQILAKNNTQTTTLTITYAGDTALADTNNKIKPLSNTKTLTPQLLDNEEEQPEVSITVTYPFRQDAESGTVTQEKHLVEYDCTTNGGTSCTNYKEYVSTGQSVNLENEGTQKSQYAFLGWNTDKDATEGLSALTMGNNDIKLYAIYKKDKITFNSVTTTSTTNSITVVANASALSEITKYEYSTDGTTYYEGSIDTTNQNSTYTFTGLTQNTSYPIYVKATTKSGISDIYEVKGVDLTENVVTEGDGLYHETDIDGRYTYRGSNPNNYITFNGEEAGWRIVSIESDGTYKIIKIDSIENMKFDDKDNRNELTDTYCTYASTQGCNAWAKTSSLKTNNIILSNELANGIFHQYGSNGGTSIVGSDSNTSGDYSGTVTKDASLNTYLNGDYYVNTLKSNSNIAKHDFAISTSGNYDTEDIATDVEQEKLYTWSGYVGLITLTDYMRASSSTSCTTLKVANSSPYPCKDNNYLFTNIAYWTITPYVSLHSSVKWLINSDGTFWNPNTQATSGVRPVVYLKSDINIKGDGTPTEPYYISKGADTKSLQTPSFTETTTSTGKTITIDYHKECGSNGITCTYIKDGVTTSNLTGSTQTVEYTDDGTLVATISDGTNTVRNPVSSSYTVKMPTGSEYITNLATTDSTLITDDYGNIRYSGSTVNNYVCMANETTCSAANLYRIIGVFNNIKKTTSATGEKRIKLIKATGNGSVYWNNSTNNNNWTEASLKTYLNSSSYTYYSNSLIDNAVWNIGGYTTIDVTSRQMYTYERGNETCVTKGKCSNTTRPITWTGKVALMYPSDYGYASSACKDGSKTLRYYNDSTCKNSNWLYLGSNEWTLTPSSNYSDYAFRIINEGFMTNTVVDSGNTSPHRPTFYLKSTVNIIADADHDGSSSKPYLLS